MAHQTVLKVKKASFQQGNKPIKANKYGRAKPSDDFMPGGYIVGNDGLDLTVYVEQGWTIRTETFIDVHGPAMKIWTEKP